MEAVKAELGLTLNLLSEGHKVELARILDLQARVLSEEGPPIAV